MDKYNEGALVAVGLLMALHDNPVAAADILRNMSLQNADCTDLDEYDKNNLRRINEPGINLTGL